MPGCSTCGREARGEPGGRGGAGPGARDTGPGAVRVGMRRGHKRRAGIGVLLAGGGCGEGEGMLAVMPLEWVRAAMSWAALHLCWRKTRVATAPGTLPQRMLP